MKNGMILEGSHDASQALCWIICASCLWSELPFRCGLVLVKRSSFMRVRTNEFLVMVVFYYVVAVPNAVPCIRFSEYRDSDGLDS